MRLADGGVHEVAGLLVAARATGPDATGSQLAVSLAAGAGGAQPRVERGCAAALVDSVLGHDATANLADAAHGGEEVPDAHHAVERVDLVVEGSALAANQATSAENGFAAHGSVSRAVAEAGGPGHDWFREGARLQ